MKLGINNLYKKLDISINNFMKMTIKKYLFIENEIYKLISFLLICVFWGSNIYAQRCGTHQHFISLQSKNPKLYESIIKYQTKLNQITSRKEIDVIQAEELIYKIPIVVHIMHNNRFGNIGGKENSNITDEQIFSQIEVLNEDFRRKPNTKGFNNNPVGADVMIEFCLANQTPDGKPSNGINRVYYGEAPYDFLNINEEIRMKSMSYWPSNQYLNIWVINIKDGTLGITQYPNESGLEGIDVFNTDEKTDGAVVHYTAFGRIGEVERFSEYGHSTTHEIGHWLGLIHIWGDEFCGTDYVSDTPTQSQSSIGLSERCPSTFSNCNGRTTQDMNNNYMDYSPDICMNIFTIEQKKRMRTALVNSPRRANLIKNNKSCNQNVAVENNFFKNLEWRFNQDELLINNFEAFGEMNLEIYNIMGVRLASVGLPHDASSFSLPINRNDNKYFVIKLEKSNQRWIKKVILD
ncbi:MAG: zinc metalloprotease [Cytophagales bacterium]|nr:MAG: zinc metalloprotease [Cytophagales bacterium]